MIDGARYHMRWEQDAEETVFHVTIPAEHTAILMLPVDGYDAKRQRIPLEAGDHRFMVPYAPKP